jgi:hypothetical protein
MSRDGQGRKFLGVRVDGPRIGFLIFDALLLCLILWLLLADFSVREVNFTAWLYPGDQITLDPTDSYTVQLGALKELRGVEFAGGQWDVQKPINLGGWPWELEWAYVSEPASLSAPIDTTLEGSEIILLHIESDKDFVVYHVQERYGWMRYFALILFVLLQVLFWSAFRSIDKDPEKAVHM